MFVAFMQKIIKVYMYTTRIFNRNGNQNGCFVTRKKFWMNIKIS